MTDLSHFRTMFHLSAVQMEQAVNYLQDNIVPRLFNKEHAVEAFIAKASHPQVDDIRSEQSYNMFLDGGSAFLPPSDDGKTSFNTANDYDFGSSAEANQPVSAIAATSTAPNALQSAPFVKIFETEAEDHGNNYIQAATHTTIPGLEQCDMGWLITSSKGLVNLWRCDVEGNEVFPPLVNMHSQTCEFRIHNLDVIDLNRAKFLVASSSGGSSGNGSVLLMSLNADSIFSLKARISLPELTQAISLCALEGPLSKAIACSFGTGFSVFDLGSSIKTPKATVEAHEDKVSILQISHPSGRSLFSGCVDGSVFVWDMRRKPVSPVQELLSHKRLITGVEAVTQDTVLTCSTDSTVLYWDLRNIIEPVRRVVADGSSILSMKTRPSKDLLALTTLKGALVLDYESGVASSLSSKEETSPLVVRYCFRYYASADQTVQMWNGNGNGQNEYIYEANMNGSICVFRPE